MGQNCSSNSQDNLTGRSLPRRIPESGTSELLADPQQTEALIQFDGTVDYKTFSTSPDILAIHTVLESDRGPPKTSSSNYSQPPSKPGRPQPNMDKYNPRRGKRKFQRALLNASDFHDDIEGRRVRHQIGVALHNRGELECTTKTARLETEVADLEAFMLQDEDEAMADARGSDETEEIIVEKERPSSIRWGKNQVRLIPHREDDGASDETEDEQCATSSVKSRIAAWFENLCEDDSSDEIAMGAPNDDYTSMDEDYYSDDDDRADDDLTNQAAQTHRATDTDAAVHDQEAENDNDQWLGVPSEREEDEIVLIKDEHLSLRGGSASAEEDPILATLFYSLP